MIHCQRCGGETVERVVDGRSRPVCVACGAVTYLDPKLAVAVVIVRDEMILLGRRGPGASESGKWSFPAGFVERGERVESAAMREVREEVGLDVELGPLLGLYSESGETVVLAVYPATRVEGDPVPGDDIEAVDWFSPSDLPPLAFSHDRHIVTSWLAREAPGSKNI